MMLSDRIPPQALDIERVILGTCLIEREAVDAVLEQCGDDDFYSTAHRRIFSAIRGMSIINNPIDISLIAENLNKSGEIESVGGISYLAGLCETICTTERIPYYIKIIKNKSQLRKLITAGSNLIEQSFDQDAQPGEIIQTTEQKFLDMSSEQKKDGFKTAGEILPDVFEDIDKRQKGEIVGLPTGFIDLDRFTGGLEKSDLIILASRPSMGKTAFASQVAANLAKQKKIIAFFSLEMNRKQIVTRFLSHESELNLLEIRTGRLPKRDYPKLACAAGPISEYKIYIDDFAEEQVMSILSKCRRLKKQSGLDLIIIDYLQLMDGDKEKTENRQQEITKISRGLKQCAKHLDVPLLALAQLSRAPDVRSNNEHRPQLSDLRESGAIEQDADVVIFLYRPEVYFPSEENTGKAEMIIGKQRNGPIGTIMLSYRKECAKFDNIAENYQQENWTDKL
jgi:replicative DNA helicase